MPLYGWSGPGQMREMELVRTKPPKLSEPQPSQTDFQDSQFFLCGVPECGKKFRKAMIMARHFNTSHSSLFENSETWRKYVSEVREHAER